MGVHAQARVGERWEEVEVDRLASGWVEVVLAVLAGGTVALDEDALLVVVIHEVGSRHVHPLEHERTVGVCELAVAGLGRDVVIAALHKPINVLFNVLHVLVKVLASCSGHIPSVLLFSQYRTLESA